MKEGGVNKMNCTEQRNSSFTDGAPVMLRELIDVPGKMPVRHLENAENLLRNFREPDRTSMDSFLREPNYRSPFYFFESMASRLIRKNTANVVADVAEVLYVIQMLNVVAMQGMYQIYVEHEETIMRDGNRMKRGDESDSLSRHMRNIQIAAPVVTGEFIDYIVATYGFVAIDEMEDIVGAFVHAFMEGIVSDHIPPTKLITVYVKCEKETDDSSPDFQSMYSSYMIIN